MKNIVLLTNEINPYRKSFYDQLHDYCASIGIDFTVLLMTKVEHGYNWDYEKVKSDYAILMKGVHFSFPINNYINVSVLKLLKKIKPEILIIGGSYFYYTNWLVLANKGRIHCPFYFWSETHLHEEREYGSFKKRIREGFRKRIYRKFDGFWYSGKLSKEMIGCYANPGVHYHFVPNLIDHQTYYRSTRELRHDKAALRKKWGIPVEGRNVIITPARLAWVKGIHTFLDLLKRSDASKNVTMLIPGTGDYRKEIEQKIAETGIDVRLLGYQQQEAVMELYALADFFVMPSLSDPNPLTCIEALWCGLPLLVSTHVGNYPEAVQEGKNGYVFDYSKPDEAVEKINRLLSSSDEWRMSAGEASLSIARQYYDSQKVVQRLIDDMVRENSEAEKSGAARSEAPLVISDK